VHVDMVYIYIYIYITFSFTQNFVLVSFIISLIRRKVSAKIRSLLIILGRKKKGGILVGDMIHCIPKTQLLTTFACSRDNFYFYFFF
jgi:hypothetical protein